MKAESRPPVSCCGASLCQSCMTDCAHVDLRGAGSARGRRRGFAGSEARAFRDARSDRCARVGCRGTRCPSGVARWPRHRERRGERQEALLLNIRGCSQLNGESPRSCLSPWPAPAGPVPVRSRPYGDRPEIRPADFMTRPRTAAAAAAGGNGRVLDHVQLIIGPRACPSEGKGRRSTTTGATASSAPNSHPARPAGSNGRRRGHATGARTGQLRHGGRRGAAYQAGRRLGLWAVFGTVSSDRSSRSMPAPPALMCRSTRRGQVVATHAVARPAAGHRFRA